MSILARAGSRLRIAMLAAAAAALAGGCRERADREMPAATGAEVAKPAAEAAPAAPAASEVPAGLIDASGSLAAVRADFNAHRGESRFLTLLSPT